MYDWKRFWIPAVEKSELLGTSLFGGDGFLPDPDIDFVYRDKKPQTLDTYRDKHCLVMLGEMGIGKTTELETEVAALKKEGKTTLYVKGIQINDKNELRRKTEETDTFRTWQNASGDLYLFIDGFDEALLRNEAFAHDLLEMLEDHREHSERLYLRITSRPFDWHNEMAGETFASMWESNAVEVIKLCILRHRDVALTLSKNGLKESDFFKVVTRLKIGYLASQPITLKLLLAEYSRNQKLSSSKVDIFNHGTLRLCEDDNPNRQKLRSHRNKMPAEDAQRFAGSLAMLGIFSRRPLIYTGKPSIYKSNADLEHASIHATGTLIQNYLNTGSANVQAVIETSLFEGLDDYLFTWKHRSYAEYLAAKAIVDTKVNPKQIRQLIVSHVDNAGNERIVPELRGMVSWLISMDSDYLHMVKNIDPEVCINADLTGVDDVTKLEIAKAFLDKNEAVEVSVPKWRTWYHQLRCAGLSSVLKEYIENKTLKADTRYLAIEIANDCKCIDLHKELLSVTLDASENTDIRGVAAKAVSAVYPDDKLNDLRPLLDVSNEEDPNDYIFAAGISRLWPSVINTQKLLKHLETHKANDNFTGSYAMFCSYDLPDNLKPSELPNAILWAGELSPWGIGPKNRAAEGILKRGFEEIEDQDVCSALAQAFLDWSRRLHAFWECDKENSLGSSSTRFRFYNHVLQALQGKDSEQGRNAGGWSPQVIRPEWRREDLLWIIDTLPGDNDDAQKGFLLQLASRYILSYPLPSENNVEHAAFMKKLELLSVESHFAQKVIDNLNQKFQNIRAQRMQAQKQAERELAELDKKIIGTPVEDAYHCNALFDAVTIIAREHFKGKLYDVNEPQIVVGGLPSDLFKKTTVFAKKYLTLHSPDLAVPNTYNNENGKRAVSLLWHAEQKWPEDNHNILLRWIPALLYTWETGDEHLRGDILPYLEKEYNEDFLKAVSDCFSVHTMQKEPNFQWINILNDVDARTIVIDHILPYLKKRKSRKNMQSFHALLEFAVGQGGDQVITYTTYLLKTYKKTNTALAASAAQKLILYWPEHAFEKVLRVFENTPEVGILAIADTPQGGQINQIGDLQNHLKPNQIARLVIWLQEHFPNIDSLTGFANVAGLKRGLITTLAAMGSKDALDAIEILIKKFSKDNWFKRIKSDIYNNIAMLKYERQSPEKLIELFGKPARRLVSSERVLQNVVLEALDDVRSEILGSKPSCLPDFYSDKDGGIKYPKAEEDFSRVIARLLKPQLEERNIAIVLEERTNLKDRLDISFISFQDGRQFNVIVESKCCWNPESRRRKMEEQLAGKYMKFGATTRYGVFLVGWYGCKGCKRNCKVKKLGYREFESWLLEQANTLNSKHDINIVPFVMDVSLKSESLNE